MSKKNPLHKNNYFWMIIHHFTGCDEDWSKMNRVFSGLKNERNYQCKCGKLYGWSRE